MTTTTVREKSPFIIDMAFTDAAGDPVVPTTVDYRVDNMSAGIQAQDWTTAGTPAASMSFTIAGSLHLIADEDNISERFRVTVRIDNGLPSEAYRDMPYKVINLKQVDAND